MLDVTSDLLYMFIIIITIHLIGIIVLIVVSLETVRGLKRNFLFPPNQMWNHFLLLVVQRLHPLRSPQKLLPHSITKSALSKLLTRFDQPILSHILVRYPNVKACSHDNENSWKEWCFVVFASFIYTRTWICKLLKRVLKMLSFSSPCKQGASFSLQTEHIPLSDGGSSKQQ